MTATVRPAGSERRALSHVGALDGLRGVAVAAVLLNHDGRLVGGWLGVDTFFALSGYLITSLLLLDHQRSAEGKVRLGRFWSRRVRRLGPALVLTLLGVAAYARWVALPIERIGIRWDGIATLFEVANWRTILTGGDYWASNLPPSPLNHTWSLSIEEQIYILWPLVVVGILIWRKRPGAVAVASLLGAVASAALMITLERRGAANVRLYEGTDTRASTLLFGAAVAAIRIHLGPARWRRTWTIRVVLGIAAALPLLWWWTRLDGATRTPYQGILPLAGLCAALVVASITDARKGGPLGLLLAWKPLQGLGRISYGVYLYHWPIFLWLNETRTTWSGWALFGLRCLVTLGVSVASYVFVEMPVRRGALKGRRAHAAIVGGAALAIGALLLATLGARPSPRAENFDDYFFKSSKPDAPTVVFAGDSVPLLLATQLVQQVDELGVNLGAVTNLGCHPLAPVATMRGSKGDIMTPGDCRSDGGIRKGIAFYEPDVSILMFGEFPNDTAKLDGQWRSPCDPQYLEAYRRQVLLTIDDLKSAGGKVVLITTPGSTVSWILDSVDAGMDRRVDCRNRLLTSIADDEPGVGLVDLAALVCPPGENCLDTLGGVNLREDGLHFVDEGAAVINRWLIPRVLAAAKDS